MIRRAGWVLWIALLIPAVRSQAGLPVPGPPSTQGRDFGVGVVIFVAGALGLLILRRRRNARAETATSATVPGREKVLRVVCWLLLIGGPGFYVVRTAGESFQREKVQRTMSDMRRIAAGWEARAQELNRYNAAGMGITYVRRGEKTPTVLPYTIGSEEAARLLVPKYMASFPMRDGWGNEWLLALDQAFPGTADTPAVSYAIASPGRDGKFGPQTNGNEPCAAWECDIVFSNGEFITRFPSDDAHDLR
jgi:hypothetical protein